MSSLIIADIKQILEVQDSSYSALSIDAVNGGNPQSRTVQVMQSFFMRDKSRKGELLPLYFSLLNR